MESHGDFTHSADIAAVRAGVGSEAFALLWDAHHTFVAGHEPPADTYAALGRWIRHTHLKDSTPQGADRRYVLTGTGEVPGAIAGPGARARRLQGLLPLRVGKEVASRDRGARVAFPHYPRTMTGYLEDAGVTAL